MRDILREQGAVLDAIGEEQLLDWRASGWSTKRIRVHLGLQDDVRAPLGGGGQRALYTWLHAVAGRWERWQAAGRMGAEAHVDDASDIADEATPDDAAVARLRVEQKRYVAEHLDPATFGRKAADVTINLGGLHLEAARDVQVAVLAEREALRLGATGEALRLGATVPPPTDASAGACVVDDTAVNSTGVNLLERYATLLD